jgi:glutathione synthase/RimK-type ligase-like ATP-grasp enzyme
MVPVNELSHPMVAVVTCSDLTRLGSSERLLVRALATHGARPRVVAWDDPSVSWRDFDCILLVACWNYHLKFNEFLSWLATLNASRVPVWNPVEVVRWNARKTYLLDISHCGIPVIPTTIVAKGGRVRLSMVMLESGWDTVVIKPVVGASGFRTHLVRMPMAEQAQALLDSMADLTGAIIQPLVTEIESGEYSFVFIDGQYSHTILKTVRHGDFRAGKQFGGAETLVDPATALIDEARSIVELTSAALLYSRVDALVIAGHLTVMEVELIEPWLGFNLYPAGADALAIALASRLR